MALWGCHLGVQARNGTEGANGFLIDYRHQQMTPLFKISMAAFVLPNPLPSLFKEAACLSECVKGVHAFTLNGKIMISLIQKGLANIRHGKTEVYVSVCHSALHYF